MRRIRVLVHPTCASSYEVVRHLAARELLDKVELIVADNPSIGLRHGAWSVPWVIVGWEPAAADPVTPQEVEAMVRNEIVSLPGDPVEAFMKTVLYSAYASSVVTVWGSLDPVLDEDLASAAVRAPLTGISPNRVLADVRDRAGELYEKWIGMIYRALGVSFVREMWWSTGGSITPEELSEAATPAVVGAWLLAKASLGRVGLPSNPRGRVVEAAKAISGFVARNAKGLINKVKKEQEKILGDKEYWSIISKFTRRY
jgi:predicted thioredoxin/glutaredoxin